MASGLVVARSGNSISCGNNGSGSKDGDDKSSWQVTRVMVVTVGRVTISTFLKEKGIMLLDRVN